MQLFELGRYLEGRIVGNPEAVVERLAVLEHAGSDDISFIPKWCNPRSIRHFQPAAVIADTSTIIDRGINSIIVSDPVLACARAACHLEVKNRAAVLSAAPRQPYEKIDPTADIHPSATLGERVTVGEQTVIGAGCRIDSGVRIGSHSEVGPNTVVTGATCLGNRVQIGANCVIGGRPFVSVRDGSRWLQVPDFASVLIDDDVKIGQGATIDRGVVNDTRLRVGVVIDSQVHIGHGVDIGANSAIAAKTGISGEARIGRDCMIGGAVGIGEGIEIADGVTVTGMSMVSKSLSTAGARYSSGWPAMRARRWWRFVARSLSTMK